MLEYKKHANFVDFKKAHKNDAGYDLYAANYTPQLIAPGQRCLINTGISVKCPDDYYFRIAPRSGFANKSGIDVLGGVVDSGYRGEVKVILINLGKNVFKIERGEKIAQLIPTKICNAEFKCVDSFHISELVSSGTQRGVHGFGSTDNKVSEA